jgi:glycosyltransferase involved in cell wall biosynthesis
LTATPPLRLSLQTGCLFRHDAVSNSLLLKLDAIAAARGAGAQVDGRALASWSEVERHDVLSAPGATGLLEHPWFRSADVCVYEYGIWYEAFDTVFATAPDVATVAFYHGVTPPGLARSPDVRRLLERSCEKKPNLFTFDHVMCASGFCRDELIELGVEEDRLSVVPLPPSLPAPPLPRGEPAPEAHVELLYVGRFVQAKGVVELLHATLLARALCGFPFRLTLVGNERLSEPAIVSEVHRLASAPDLTNVVTVLGEVEDDQLAALYRVTDAVVIPSYHEGYCVPVVEAVSAGAHVITSDAGNLPYVVDGVGRTVPAGDVPALAGAIADLVTHLTAARRGQPLEIVTDNGVIDEVTWKAATEEHRRRHSATAYTDGFWRAVSAALVVTGRERPAWMATV